MRANVNNNKIYGINTVLGLITNYPDRVLSIFVAKINPKTNQIINLAAKYNIAVQKININNLDKWFGEANHQGIAAEIRPKILLNTKDLIHKISKDSLFLVLDNIQDPRNLGACIRSAAGFNISAVIIDKNKGCGITPAVNKVSSGAIEEVDIAMVSNLLNCLKLLKQNGVWVVALAANYKTPLSQIDLTGPIALVLGSEEDGIRKIIKDNSDFLAGINMYNNNIESLNISVVTGISLYEATRQRVLNTVPPRT